MAPTKLTKIESAALFVEVARDLTQIRARFIQRVDKFKDDYVKALEDFDVVITEVDGLPRRVTYEYTRKNGLVVRIFEQNIDYLDCEVTQVDGTVLSSVTLDLRLVSALTDRDLDVKTIESIGTMLSVFCRWNREYQKQLQRKKYESKNRSLIEATKRRFSEMFGRGSE